MLELEHSQSKVVGLTLAFEGQQYLFELNVTDEYPAVLHSQVVEIDVEFGLEVNPLLQTQYTELTKVASAVAEVFGQNPF